MNTLDRLHQAVSAVAPINGVTIGDIANRSTWLVDYQSSATPAQRTSGQNVVNTFDPTALTAEETQLRDLTNDPTAIGLKNLLLTSTPTQLNDYVNTQVIDLNTAKTLLKKMLLLIAISLVGKT